MEGFLTYYYEYHFLYINGIHHVESQNIQGLSLMKLHLPSRHRHGPGHGRDDRYVNRARAFMPPGTVPPFVMRFDTGSVPVGYLVLSSDTRSIGRDPGPGPVPGAADVRQLAGRVGAAAVRRQSADHRRHLDPERLRAYDISPDEVVQCPVQGNAISPSGNVPHRRQVSRSCRSIPWSATSTILENIPLRAGTNRRSICGTWATSQDASDIATGYALVNGRRSDLHPGHQAGRRLHARVVNVVKAALPDMQEMLAARHPRQLRVRPIALCHAGDLGRGERRDAGGGARPV